ncbi:MAG: DEAD/DEAH box helicase [Myxococcales bacterium]|nr:DEAD/DEAH box helicase [Myxococcales bacterium]
MSQTQSATAPGTFAALGLAEPLLRAVAAEGYTTPTPIQLQAIPALLAGRDMVGVAQTGTGKTAAFSLPVLHHLIRQGIPKGRRHIRALILSPTRELAAQIQERFDAYSKHVDLRSMVIFGGVKQGAQVKSLHGGVDILVATPGRLLDLHGQGHLDLSRVEYFVLDEADRMLDMGFIHDIRKVLAVLPPERQNLLFSATMPSAIVKLARGFIHDPVRVEVTPQATTVERIEQSVWFCQKNDKRALLAALLRDDEIDRALVFTRTKHGANRLTKQMVQDGFSAAAIHGNKSQNARVRALDGFKDGSVKVLIATDVAARGIDVEGVSHVFNYELPNIAESYVHRIGRTGRAGRDGIAIALCDDTEGEYLLDIEKLTGEPIERVMDHPWHFPGAVPTARKPTPHQGGKGAHHGRSKPPVEAPRGRSTPPERPAQAPQAAPSAEGDGEAPKRRRRRRRGGGGGGGEGAAQAPAQAPRSPAPRVSARGARARAARAVRAVRAVRPRAVRARPGAVGAAAAPAAPGAAHRRASSLFGRRLPSSAACAHSSPSSCWPVAARPPSS